MQDLISEKQELDDRIVNIENLMKSEDFATKSGRVADTILAQLYAMKIYSRMLSDRIKWGDK